MGSSIGSAKDLFAGSGSFRPPLRIELERITVAPSQRRFRGKKLRVVGLFSGIGGFELGLHRAGHKTLLLCENEPGAQVVLRAHFPEVSQHPDVRDLTVLPPRTDLLVGGFPCQDLSQAGKTVGINGAQSSLVGELLRLARSNDVPWLLLENVSFMLQLAKGEALEFIVRALEDLGYSWAYRVVDSRSLGVPQRRQRVFILASKVGNPCDILLADDAGDQPEPSKENWRSAACGFYWTEGSRGLGWAHDAIPTLKPGSTLSIPSPPAIVLKSGEIVKPEIRDAERLQGFPVDWTLPAAAAPSIRPSHRWKLVGNAVTVQVAEWIGRRLREPGRYDGTEDQELNRTGTWPSAAWGHHRKRWTSSVSKWPRKEHREPLEDFLQYEPTPLSERAATGFYLRATRSSLRFPRGFLDTVRAHTQLSKKAHA